MSEKTYENLMKVRDLMGMESDAFKRQYMMDVPFNAAVTVAAHLLEEYESAKAARNLQHAAFERLARECRAFKEERDRFHAALHRIRAWSFWHKEEPRTQLRNTTKLIHDEAAKALNTNG